MERRTTSIRMMGQGKPPVPFFNGTVTNGVYYRDKVLNESGWFHCAHEKGKWISSIIPDGERQCSCEEGIQ
ncbi:hypothetical protein BACI349Y_50124 [Bacillus sp. 349Y]|nr:hypothetical protein BACI349Y_50124 [Bacillus sp. 349Y]